jgi:four helix bundle protein
MFVAYQVSLEMIRKLAPIVPAIAKHDRDLVDQLQRAASSVALNLAESQGRAGGDRRRHIQIAAGSAFEVRGALEVADAWGWTLDTSEVMPVLNRLIGLLWGLRPPCARVVVASPDALLRVGQQALG